MGTAQFTFTEDDMIAAQRAWWTGWARWQSFVRASAVLWLIYAAIAVAITWDAAFKVKAIAAGYAGAIAVLAVLIGFASGFFMAPYRARKAIREHKALAGQYEVSWDSEAIAIRYVRGASTLPWTIWYGWLDGPATLLLYQSSILFNAIPKRALRPGEADAIVGHLVTAGIPERKPFGLFAAKRSRNVTATVP